MESMEMGTQKHHNKMEMLEEGDQEEKYNNPARRSNR